MRLTAFLFLTACTPAAAPPSAVVLAPAASTETSSTSTPVVPATDCAERRTLAQAEFDAAFANPDDAMKLARIVPVTQDGGSAIRLFGIRSDSTLGRWGIHNGDEIVTLDGHPINDPDTLVEAYTDARQRTDLELVVVRDGQPRTLCYHVERR